jgi:AdoMet-dependent rRNA methyltransferase SPB1
MKMVQYKEELLKTEAPEEEKEEETMKMQQEQDAKEVEASKEELSEKEKDQLVREELAQLRANLLAKKRREKKKVSVQYDTSINERRQQR